MFIVSREASEKVQDIMDNAWLEFHGGNINSDEEFYDFIQQEIDNAVIYNYDCETYLKGNMDYCFEEHDLWGKAENVNQAAYALLYDYSVEEGAYGIWSEMEEVLNEE